MEGIKRQKKLFTKLLLDWHIQHNTRSLPWKNETDPYKIWLSEIILQQTRAEQGLPYYLRFIETYPSVQKLASAKDEEVFRLWQGLGYYNRCKNLLHTARVIAHDMNGKFPSTYEEILKLKGIGAYTAAAIASFAFHLPYAVVDGNVNRVLARFFGIDIPVDSAEGKKFFQILANELLEKNKSAAFNQAIMDFGAMICTPLNSKCSGCILQKNCFAHQKNSIAFFPVKSKKAAVKKRYFHYLLLTTNDEKIWIRKRTAKDIWQNLYEPFLIEHYFPLDKNQLVKNKLVAPFKSSLNINFDGTHSQRLTHQLIESRFFSACVPEATPIIREEGAWVPFKELKKFPFPKTIVSFLQKNFYF